MTTTIGSVPNSLLNAMNPNVATGATDPNAPPSGADSAAKLQNNFMTMLITQMKNQNPLNPMDNAQVTSQLAQLSTVSGISQLNSSVNNLLTAQGMQSANLIGKNVVVPGNAISLSSGSAVFGAQLATAASNVQVTISNASGQIVDTMDVGSLPAGVSAIPWNGKTKDGATAPDGQYTFTIKAVNGADKVTASPLAVGLVSSVTMGATGPQLNIPNVGQSSLSSVVQIL